MPIDYEHLSLPRHAHHHQQHDPMNGQEEVVGLGLAIEVSVYGNCRVLHTIVGGSAHGCGKILPGDSLLAVLDQEKSSEYVHTEGLDFNEVKILISGRSGSKVTLKMQRQDGMETGGNEIYYCENLVRAPIHTPPLLQPRTSLDAFSLFNPVEIERTSPGQGMEGVGILLDFRPDSEFPTVSSLVPGRSAKACGKIEIGDSLVSVDTQSTKCKPFNEIRNMIAGSAGTFVSLVFEGRNGTYECEKLMRGSLREASNGLDEQDMSLMDSPRICKRPNALGASHHNDKESTPLSMQNGKLSPKDEEIIRKESFESAQMAAKDRICLEHEEKQRQNDEGRSGRETSANNHRPETMPDVHSLPASSGNLLLRNGWWVGVLAIVGVSTVAGIAFVRQGRS